jgi:peptide/nickel transport system ATP-binding protein
VTAETLLSVEDLHLRFAVFEGVSHVLRGVSLSVAAGERVAVVGESGCGKSVLLRSILALLDPRRRRIDGAIRFEGEDLLRQSERRMRAIRGARISMIFQDPTSALNPAFTIGEQLAEVILRHGGATNAAAARQIAWDGLRQVAIDDPDRVLASYPFQLSGGMNQRVMIVMALVNHPRLVLADEPGTALDVTVQEQTLRLMHTMTTESGAAVLLITHNLGVVRRFAERVYVMYAGTIVEEAPTEALFAAPRHPYTRALLDAVPRLTGGTLPRPIAGMVPDFVAPPPGCRFSPRCAQARDACRAPPPLVAVAPGHHVACVLYDAATADAS